MAISNISDEVERTAEGLRRRAEKEEGLGPVRVRVIELPRFFVATYLPPFTFRFSTQYTGVFRVVVTLPLRHVFDALKVKEAAENAIFENATVGTEGVVSIRFLPGRWFTSR